MRADRSDVVIDFSDTDDVSDSRPLSSEIPPVPTQRSRFQMFLNKHGISSGICFGIFSVSDFINEQTQTGLKACFEFYANPDIDKYEIRTIKKDRGHFYSYFSKA